MDKKARICYNDRVTCFCTYIIIRLSLDFKRCTLC